MDETTWGALAVVLTLLGGGYTYWAFVHRGVASGTRGAALTLLPAAAWATGTLQMFTRIVDAVVDWATSLVFSPLVWFGVGLAGLSAVLFVLSRYLRDRAPGGGRAVNAVDPMTGGARQELPKAKKPKSEPVIDDEMADIEALLRKRGIT